MTYLLSVSIAYPGTLGLDLIEPPQGWAFLVDDDGVFFTDDAGNFLIVEEVNG